MAYIGISPNFVSQNRHEIVTPHIYNYIKNYVRICLHETFPPT